MFFKIFKNKQRVLILDRENRAESLASRLREHQFEIATASSEPEISPLLVSFKPDLIVVGISLPELDGIDFLRKLREIRASEPLVVLSDIPTLDTKILARAYGAVRYRRRPVSTERLVTLIQQALSERQDVDAKRVFPATPEEAALFHTPGEEAQVIRSLQALTQPRSVVVVGASETPGKAAERRTRSLLEGGYAGKLYPVNPKRATIFGERAYPSVNDVPDNDIDLAVLIIAREAILEAVQQCCAKGAKTIIVITAGLGESDAGGKQIEDEMLRVAATTGTRIVGPNCSGVYSGPGSLNLLGVPGIPSGPFSVIAQSGNVIDSLCYYASVRNLGFSRIFSAGNAIGFSFHHYLEFLNQDPNTDCVMLYIEGLREGMEFMESARRTVRNKPVIAIKVGDSEAGMRAAASHTASIASAREIVDVALRQSGVIRAHNVDEMFELAEALAYSPRPESNRVAIVSEGGGDNAIACENAARVGLHVPLLSKKAQEKITPHLLTNMPAHNPIDYGGVAEEDPVRIERVCRAALDSGEIDSVYVTGFYGGFSEIISERIAEKENETARNLIKLVEDVQKPVVVHSSFARAGAESLEILKRGHIPVYESAGRAARALAALSEYAAHCKRLGVARPISHEEVAEEYYHKAAELVAEARHAGRTFLLETESRAILEQYSFPLVPARFVTRIDEVEGAIEAFGFPLAMKIVSPDIIHKSDVGGIQLGIEDDGQAFSAFKTILRAARKVTAHNRIHGVLISPMAAAGVECIIGMVRDPIFGPVIMFGMGGVLVEALKDIAFRVLPLTEGDIEDMVRETLGFSLLRGYRGKPAANLEGLYEVLRKVAQLAEQHPDITEIDLNPVIAHPEAVTVVDSRIIVAP